MRLGQGLERQAAELSRLSEERLGQRLDGEARLAGAQVEALFDTIGRRLESIAQRADVVKVVASANVVPIWDLLGRAARAADIDGILREFRDDVADAQQSYVDIRPSSGRYLDIVHCGDPAAENGPPIAKIRTMPKPT